MKSGRKRNPYLKLLSNIKKSGGRARAMTKIRLGQKISVSVTAEDLKKIYEHQNAKCFWFNIPMDLDLLYSKWHPLAPSADRLDESRGYDKDNIVICTRLSNLGRQRYNIDKFREIITFLKNQIKYEV
jgi:hypothetical protein